MLEILRLGQFRMNRSVWLVACGVLFTCANNASACGQDTTVELTSMPGSGRLPEAVYAVSGANRPASTPDTTNKATFEPTGAFRFFAGIVIPTGDFSSNDNPSSGFAKLGYSFGVDYLYQWNGSLSWLSGVTYSRNPVDASALVKASGISPSLNLLASPWHIVWLLSGVRFNVPMSRSLEFVGSVQAGLVAGSRPGISVERLTDSLLQASKFALGPGYRLAAGMVVNRMLSVGLRYGFTTLPYAEEPSSSNPYLPGSYKQEVAVVQIVLGFVL